MDSSGPNCRGYLFSALSRHWLPFQGRSRFCGYWLVLVDLVVLWFCVFLGFGDFGGNWRCKSQWGRWWSQGGYLVEVEGSRVGNGGLMERINKKMWISWKVNWE